MPSEPLSKEELGSLLINHHEAAMVLAAINANASIKARGWAKTRAENLSLRIREYYDDSPEIVEELRRQENAKANAYAGVLAVVETANIPEEEANYLDTTQRYLGRSALILAQLAEFDKLTRLSNQDLALLSELEEIGAEAAAERPVASAEPETAEQAPAKFRISIDNEGNTRINDQDLSLLPVSDFLFNWILDHDEPFRESDIYHLPEFEQIVRGEGQQSSVTGAYGNALRGLDRGLRKAKTTIDEFVPIIGGGPRSRIRQRTGSIEIHDERLLAQANELMDHIFDQLNPSTAVSPTQLATEFFGLERLTARHALALETALSYLKEFLSTEGVALEYLEDGLLRPVITEQSDISSAVLEEPSAFISLKEDSVVYQTKTIPLTKVEQAMLSFIRQGDPQNGITKNNIRELLRVSGFDIKDFDADFSAFRKKLGPALQRRIPRGRRGVSTRYLIKS